MRYLIPTATMMEAFGGQLALACQERAVVHLNGELGVGKTTLVRGFLRALGHTGTVKSPTYTLVEPYQIQGRLVYHFDLYRLGDPEELEYMGIRDYFTENTCCLIEWPKQGGLLTPPADVQIHLLYHNQNDRLLKLQADSPIGETIITHTTTAFEFSSQ